MKKNFVIILIFLVFCLFSETDLTNREINFLDPFAGSSLLPQDAEIGLLESNEEITGVIVDFLENGPSVDNSNSQVIEILKVKYRRFELSNDYARIGKSKGSEIFLELKIRLIGQVKSSYTIYLGRDQGRWIVEDIETN